MNNQPDAPDPKFRDEILETFWGPSSARKTRYFNGDLVCHDSTLTHDAYFDYFNRLWSLMVEHQTTGNNSNSASATRLRDMQALARLAINGEARETILATLHETPQSPNTLNLAASLLSMLKIGAVKYRSNPRGVLSWSAGSLKSFLAHHFQVAPILSCEGVRLPKAFDAWSLSIIGGLEVEFTDNLADHLLYVGDSKVLIFHHATFLEFQQRDLFPPGLLDETLRTLALLFPQSEFGSRRRSQNGKQKWLERLAKQHQPWVIDDRLAKCGSLEHSERQIERFYFWRDRLVILKQAYDDATPRTISQWFYDRRNGVQWYTFWVAILVFCTTTGLGVIQVVEGGLQVYKAYNPSA